MRQLCPTQLPITVVPVGPCRLCPAEIDHHMLVGQGVAMNNGPGLKGIHLAMESGMMAADTIVEALAGAFVDNHQYDVT